MREGGGHASEDFKGTGKEGRHSLQRRPTLLPQQQDGHHWLGPMLGQPGIAHIQNGFWQRVRSRTTGAMHGEIELILLALC